MDKILNTFNSLTVTGKTLIIVLAILVILFIVLLLVYLLKKDKGVNNEIDLDFFDELKKENDNTKSVFVKEEKELAVKIETEPKEKIDLQSISNKMEKDIEKSNIDLTEFEMEQEEKAIISYKELINKVKQNEMNNVNVQTVDLDDRGYELPEVEFSYDTEVLDFSDLLEQEDAKFKPSEFITPINGIESPSTEMIKKTDIKSILDLDDVEEPIYTNNEFLSALKDLRDSLQ